MPLPDWFHEVARRVSNRGRWGADDEIGTINLITPEATRRQRRLRQARCVVLARAAAAPRRRADRAHPEPREPDPHHDRHQHGVHRRSRQGVPVGRHDRHGLQAAATHWDGLAHASYENRLYNGFRRDGRRGGRCHEVRHPQAETGRDARHSARRRAREGRQAARRGLSDQTPRISTRRSRWRSSRSSRATSCSCARGRWSTCRPATRTRTVCRAWPHRRHGALVPVSATSRRSRPTPCRSRSIPARTRRCCSPVHLLLHLVEMGMTQGQNWYLDGASPRTLPRTACTSSC